MGVGGAPSPIKDRVRPWERNVETLGVERLGKGMRPPILDVRVMVDGVRVVSVGDGGKTNSVWDGVETDDRESGMAFGLFKRLLRKWSGGGMSFLDSVRVRTGGRESVGVRIGRELVGLVRTASLLLGGVESTTMAIGEEGTGGRMPIGAGRRFPFGGGREGGLNVEWTALLGVGGILNVERMAVAGGGAMLKEVFHTGAEGGTCIEGRAVVGVNGWVR